MASMCATPWAMLPRAPTSPYLTDQPTTLVALVRAAFGIGVINRLALQTTSTEGLTIRTIDSPTAHRTSRCSGLRRRGDSAVVKAFLDAQQGAPLPPGSWRSRPADPDSPASPFLSSGSNRSGGHRRGEEVALGEVAASPS